MSRCRRGSASLSGASPATYPNNSLYLGERIRELLDERGFKGYVVARQVGVRDDVFSLWVRNKRQVPRDRLEALASVLGTTIARLVNVPPVRHPVRPSLAESLARSRRRLLLQRELAPEPEPEPTPDVPLDAVPPWQPHHGGAYVSLVPCGPMSGRVPVFHGRLVQAYGPVGRIADL